MSPGLCHGLLGRIAGALWFFQAFIQSMIPQLNHTGREQWPCLHSGCTQNLRVNVNGACTIFKKSESFWTVPAMLGDVCLFSQVSGRVEAAVQGQDELTLIARLCSHW